LCVVRILKYSNSNNSSNPISNLISDPNKLTWACCWCGISSVPPQLSTQNPLTALTYLPAQHRRSPTACCHSFFFFSLTGRPHLSSPPFSPSPLFSLAASPNVCARPCCSRLMGRPLRLAGPHAEPPRACAHMGKPPGEKTPLP
jgi:hypothetical protein